MRNHLRIDLRVGVLPAGQLVTAMPLRSFWFIGFALLAGPWHSTARAQTIGNDGSASYTFPFPLPAARGRFQPSLALTYNSNAGVSAYGLGWNLNENYIEDETRATLTTAGTTRHRYILVRDGARHLLVQAADGTYRMDVGDGYFSVVQGTSGQWSAVDGLGTSFTYMPISTTSVRSYLTRVADVDQNVTTYEYQAESQRCPLSDWNLALLSKIQYNFTAANGTGTAIHVVTLQYSPAAATQAEEAAGCLVLHDELLQRVDIARAQSAGALELGYWSLNYDVSPDTGRPRLRQIQPLDRRGSASGLNATSFAYESDQAGTTSVTPFAAGVAVSVPQSLYSSPSITECEDLTNIPLMKSCQVQDIAAWIDMDGDGLPDLAWGNGNGIQWARNITRPAAGIRGPALQFAAPVLIPDGNWPGILTFVNGGQQTQNFAIDSTTAAVVTTSLVVDVDGDGLPDLVAESALLSPAECPSGTISIRFAQRGSTQLQYAAPVCAPAGAAYIKFKALYDPTAQQLPLGYAIKASGTSASKLLMADITGDGLQDIIIYDVGVWHVYPGYRNASGVWSFSDTEIPFHADATQSDQIRTTISSGTVVDLIDVNGDGLLDRVVVGNALGWYVQYNTGKDFRPLAAMGNQTTYPFTQGVLDDLIDMNRDGRPDALTASSCGTTSSNYLEIFFGTGNPDAPFLASFGHGACMPVPPGFLTHNTIKSGGVNQGMVDMDGDGILDHFQGDSDQFGNQWIFQRGQHQIRRSDILTSVSSAMGGSTQLTWAPSTDFGVASGSPRVLDVVSSVITTGPAIAPVSMTYVYGTPLLTSAWDDPTGSLIEALGFSDRYELASGLMTHYRFGDQHFTAGVPVLVETASIAAPNATYYNTVPAATVSASTSTTWQTSPLGAATYPAYRGLYVQVRSRTEGATTLSSTLSNSAPDAFGNIAESVYIADDSAGGVAITTKRVYPTTTSPPKCVACVLEEYANTSTTGPDLFHRYYHYDDPGRADLHGATDARDGHLSWVELLVAGTGSGGTYEVPTVTKYNADGTVASVAATYAGEEIGSLTTSFTYHDFLEPSLVSVSDGTLTLETGYQYNGYGDVIEKDGPYLGTARGYTGVAMSYDDLGRVILVTRLAIGAPAGSSGSPVATFEYAAATATTPAVRKTYSFIESATSTFSYAGIPTNDDAVQTIDYFDAVGRLVQSRRRLGSGTAGTQGNVVRNLPAQYRVERNVIFDALGRVTAALDPYFSTNAGYVDARSSTELSTPGLHATSVAYDALSRPTCVLYAPVNGAIPSAAGCPSSGAEDSNYRRSTASAYGVDSTVDGRAYFTEDVTPDWGAGTFRKYFDAAGRLVWTRTPNGTFENNQFDALGRVSAVIRHSGSPTATPVVQSVWDYDLRGRVSHEFADASGHRYYSYAPTGELLIDIRNATNTTQDMNAEWTVRTIGSLGRLSHVEHHRWVKSGSCTWAEAPVDRTDFQYDSAYTGDARYGTPDELGGRLTAMSGSAATIAFGYDQFGTNVLRDEWTGEPGVRNTVAISYGADGRLLQKTMASPYLASPVSYNVNYDSVGQPVQAVDAASGLVYWNAGTGNASTDPGSGPYDALSRLAAERWDGGAISKSRTFLPGSNLLGSSIATTASTTVYALQSLSWKGSLLSGYTGTSAWEGASTSYTAAYDLDGHLQSASAAPFGAVGPASQQYNESYAFSLENLQSVSATNNLGLVSTSTYAYNDATSRERVTSVTLPSTSLGDFFDYDRRGRGLVTNHRITATQAPAQDSYEYDVPGRLISISHLGAKLEDIAYDPAGNIVSRTFTNGTDTARYYVGDDLTLVRRGTTTIGYAHLQVGGGRIASIWSKTVGSTTTQGVIYYHRNLQGSVVATTLGGGQAGISYRYLPYGDIDKVVGAEADENASELGFIGGLRLSGGLIHLRARVYSPLLRRFLQPDTIDLSRYTYAIGDPVNFIDPSGRDTCGVGHEPGTCLQNKGDGKNGPAEFVGPPAPPDMTSDLQMAGGMQITIGQMLTPESTQSIALGSPGPGLGAFGMSSPGTFGSIGALLDSPLVGGGGGGSFGGGGPYLAPAAPPGHGASTTSTARSNAASQIGLGVGKVLVWGAVAAVAVAITGATGALTGGVLAVSMAGGALGGLASGIINHKSGLFELGVATITGAFQGATFAALPMAKIASGAAFGAVAGVSTIMVDESLNGGKPSLGKMIGAGVAGVAAGAFAGFVSQFGGSAGDTLTAFAAAVPAAAFGVMPDAFAGGP